MQRIVIALGILIGYFGQGTFVLGGEPLLGAWKPVPAAKIAVPQNLFKLVHTPEVQEILALKDSQKETFLKKLSELDGPWWRSRILPDAKQRTAVSQSEEQLIALLQESISAGAIERLRQIELQSQGARVLARPDIANSLQLTPDQIRRSNDLFNASLAIEKKMEKAKGDALNSLTNDLQKAKDAEVRGVHSILTERQRNLFTTLVGAPFDTTKLERIYPFAPELISSGQWVNEPVSLRELRGRVVLLHFYAFQCNNCVANFNHYNRWHERLASQGVTVLGIQSPELPAERDANLVRKAAGESGFQFPVLIDLEMKNWNAWANTMWPTVYVIDKRGYVRHWWQGELNWQGASGDKTIESIVEKLLAEPD